VAVDTYAQIWQRVQSHCPMAGPLLAQRWTVDSFRRIAERRRWSWLLKRGQFIFPSAYETGTVTVTQNSAVVSGSGTAWTPQMAGRQFRTGVTSPIYTILQVNSATSLTLDDVWGPPSASGVTYSIYQAYVTPPSDFHAFVSLWDPNYAWQLRLNVTQAELNSWDPQRANAGQAWLAASFDYSNSVTGTVKAPIQIVGSGPSPAIAGSATYSGPADAIFTVTITAGGASGTAVFKWSKDGSAYTTGVVTDPNGGAQALQDGVQIYFPTGQTYVSGDTWVIRTYVTNAPGVPRYEIWPHVKMNYVLPFLYEARCADLDQPGAVVPAFIRGDVIMNGALEMAARWPGPSVDEPNPYYDLNLASQWHAINERDIGELERQDNETYESMTSYATNLAYAPFFYDAKFIQNHEF
jgi:hypothetical protein